jgi:integrase
MLTDRAIRLLKAPAKGQVDVSDGSDVKGLVLRVSQRARVFYLSFRSPLDGKPAKVRLGDYPSIGLADARQKGREYRAMIGRGIDPRVHEKEETERREAEAAAAKIAAERAERNTLARVAADFVQHCERAGQRRWQERERQLRVYVPAEWGDRRIEEITRGEVRELLATLERERGPVQANRVVQTLRAMFNWARREGRCDANPAADLRSAIKEASRDRVLSDAELAAVWRATALIGEPFGPYVRLLVLTGQRRSETAHMRWRDVNLNAATWEIPAIENKQGRVHGVPLSDASVALLRELTRCSGDPAAFVFTTTGGERPISGWSKAKAHLDAIIAAPVARWTLHDLRRTVASGMARLGIAPHVCEKVLGHEPAAISGVAAVYNRHDYGDEKRRALDAWTIHVATIADASDKVVPLTRRA